MCCVGWLKVHTHVSGKHAYMSDCQVVLACPVLLSGKHAYVLIGLVGVRVPRYQASMPVRLSV